MSKLQRGGQYPAFEFHQERFLEAFTTLEKMSSVFTSFCRFPTSENLVSSPGLPSFFGFESDEEYKATIGKFAVETRPIIHEDVLSLIHDFVEFKRSEKYCVESKIYTEGFNELDFVDRMISYRPLVFFTGSDSFKLRDGRTGCGGFQTESPRHFPPEMFNDYMTYDEMAISAMMGVSVPTFFINSGPRNNCGRVQRDGNFQKQGVYVGLVGARFEVDDEMESLHMTIPKRYPRFSEHRTRLLNQVWAKFYNQKYPEQDLYDDDDDDEELRRIREEMKNNPKFEIRFPTFDEVEALGNEAKGRFQPSYKSFFNIEVYRQRMRLSIDAFLLDANERARSQSKKAYVHAVGLGLGVWMVMEEQAIWLAQEFVRSLQLLQPSNIGALDFSWFPPVVPLKVSERLIDVPDQPPIDIIFSKRNPADKLTGKYSDFLLVASYAWDGNSFPGNEYWLGSLAASGDPAAACCSMIPQLQNPMVNPFLCSHNLFIASTKHKRLMGYQEFRELERENLPWLPESASKSKSPFTSDKVFSAPLSLRQEGESSAVVEESAPESLSSSSSSSSSPSVVEESAPESSLSSSSSSSPAAVEESAPEASPSPSVVEESAPESSLSSSSSSSSSLREEHKEKGDKEIDPESLNSADQK